MPKLVEAGWDTEPHAINEQRTFTDGRIVVVGERVQRRAQKRADYLLRYTRDYPIAIVEAKASYRTAGDGLQQAKEYAEILGVPFAYGTNGGEVIEFDYLTGRERTLHDFPTPDDLFQRMRAHQGLHDDSVVQQLLTPTSQVGDKKLRYYQEIAINRTVQAILQGKRRILLTMATGTGSGSRAHMGSSPAAKWYNLNTTFH